MNLTKINIGKAACLGVAVVVASNFGVAMPGNLPDGGMLVGKGAHTGFFKLGMNHNPAVLPIAIGGRSFALGGGYFPAFALEIGQVDNLSDGLDGLEEALDAAESGSSDGGEDVTQAEADAIKANFDGFVDQLDENAYVKFDANLPIPLLPVMFKAFGGTFAINAEASVGLNLEALGDELVYNSATQELETDTSVYVRSGEFVKVGVAYGRELSAITFADQTFDVSVGGRFSITKAGLSRQVIALMDDDDDDDSAFDRAEENYDLNKVDTTAVGLDLGVVLHNERSHIGATVRNLIPQEFDFADVGVNCGAKPSPSEQRDCEAAAKFAGRIDLKSTYKIEPQLMLEGSHTLHKSGLRAFGSIEANSVEDVSGDEYQWASVGLGFVGPWWLPGAQVAYQTNLAGEKLSMISVGVQLFKAVNLQLSVSPEKAEYDGDSINRAAAISLSFATSL